MVASSSRVLPKVPSLATFPVSSKTQNVCRRSPRSNPSVILFLLLAAVLLIRHRVYRQPQWRPPLPSHLISFHHSRDQGPIGRIEIKAHHVPELFLKLKVFGELESTHLMELQLMGRPESL